MDLVIDGKPEMFGPPPGTSMAAATTQIKLQLHRAGRVIRAIMLDGVELNDERMLAVMNRPVDDFKTLAVVSGISRSAGAAAADELAAASGSVAGLLTGILEAASLVQVGDPQGGLARLARVSEAADALIATVEKVAAAAALDLGAVDVHGRTVPAHIEALRRLLGVAKGKVLTGNPLQLGRLVEYDLAPTVEVWQAIVAEVRARLPGGAPRKT